MVVLKKMVAFLKRHCSIWVNVLLVLWSECMKIGGYDGAKS
jgi:hypothetical protein